MNEALPSRDFSYSVVVVEWLWVVFPLIGMKDVAYCQHMYIFFLIIKKAHNMALSHDD